MSLENIQTSRLFVHNVLPLMTIGIKTAFRDRKEVCFFTKYSELERHVISEDVILFDFDFPGEEQIISRWIKENRGQQKVAVWSTPLMRSRTLSRLIQLGVKGFFLKSVGEQELLNGLNEILRNKTSVYSSLNNFILTSRLTPKEKQTCILIQQGFSSEQILEELHVVYQTLKNHKTNIRNKLNPRPKSSELLRAMMSIEIV